MLAIFIIFVKNYIVHHYINKYKLFAIMLLNKTNLQFDYTTTYLGLPLKNPFIISSSGLTSTPQKVQKCEAMGAGAVVLKSIFEEQMLGEAASMENYSAYPEAAEYLAGYTKQEGLRNYLNLVGECAKSCNIPIIASINCYDSGSWIEYAKEIEIAGAAAIELNIFSVCSDPNTTSSEIESRFLSIAEAVNSSVSIPVSIKIPSNFTAPLNLIQGLYFRGIKGVTMFNRFYSPDIDLKKLAPHSSGVFSQPEELSSVLRWVALSSAKLPLIEIATSTGIHSAEAAAKAILCGATTVQLCTVLYQKGIEYLETIINDFKTWAHTHNYTSVNEFRGKLSAKEHSSSEIYERAQFMKYFSTFEG